VALGGWLRGPATVAERILAGIAGLLLCYAGGIADLAGVGVLVLLAAMNFFRLRTPAAT